MIICIVFSVTADHTAGANQHFPVIDVGEVTEHVGGAVEVV